MDNYTDISPSGYSSPLMASSLLEQERKRADERNETLQQVPLLKQVIDRLKKREAETDSIQQALAVAKKYGVSEREALVALNIVRPMIEAERRYIEVRVSRAK